MDLKAIIQKQTSDQGWGAFAQDLNDGGFRQPRGGRNNDQAHPPIHPVNHVARSQLNDEEWRVYEFVTRRFLACCSEDAKGETTTVELEWGGEIFSASGLLVLERNYLDVYPYDKWESTKQLPRFTLHERFIPDEANMNDGKTTAPGYLTEPELIALMDANGIGTDATMAEHIAKIKDREYVVTRPRGGGPAPTNAEGNDNESGPHTAFGRARARARGRGGRGGATDSSRGSSGAGGMEEFIPTTLGVALVEGFDAVGLDTSLSKPFLRKEVWAQNLQQGRSRQLS